MTADGTVERCVILGCDREAWSGWSTCERHTALVATREVRPMTAWPPGWFSGLTEAWAAAEDALPEGWRIVELLRGSRDWVAKAAPNPAYNKVPAHYWSIENAGSGTMWLGIAARGETPPAALNALAARLRVFEQATS